MRVVTAPEKVTLEDKDISIFLAGGITNCPEWQNDVIKEIDDLSISFKYNTDNTVLFNPRRENFPIGDPSAAMEQIKWEFEQLERCDIFSMYFSGGISDQPICMYELGRNIARMQMRFPSDWENRIIISCEEGYKRKQDVEIQTMLATKGAVSVMSYFGSDSEITLQKLHAESICQAINTLRGV